METELKDRSHLCDTHREEVASMVTHAVGIAFSVGALVVMLVLASGDALKFISALVFGISLVVLYSSSTLYHFSTTLRWKARFQTLDHICIYLLIAGSYTPFTLITLRGAWGWSIFAAVWAMAIVGIFIKTLWKGRKDHWFSTALYLLMGWLILLAIVRFGECCPWRDGLACRRWPRLHFGRYLFCMASPPIQSRRLASLRLGRERLPRACGVSLRVRMKLHIEMNTSRCRHSPGFVLEV